MKATIAVCTLLGCLIAASGLSDCITAQQYLSTSPLSVGKAMAETVLQGTTFTTGTIFVPSNGAFRGAVEALTPILGGEETTVAKAIANPSIILATGDADELLMEHFIAGPVIDPTILTEADFKGGVSVVSGRSLLAQKLATAQQCVEGKTSAAVTVKVAGTSGEDITSITVSTPASQAMVLLTLLPEDTKVCGVVIHVINTFLLPCQLADFRMAPPFHQGPEIIPAPVTKYTTKAPTKATTTTPTTPTAKIGTTTKTNTTEATDATDTTETTTDATDATTTPTTKTQTGTTKSNTTKATDATDETDATDRTDATDAIDTTTTPVTKTATIKTTKTNTTDTTDATDATDTPDALVTSTPTTTKATTKTNTTAAEPETEPEADAEPSVKTTPAAPLQLTPLTPAAPSSQTIGRSTQPLSANSSGSLTNSTLTLGQLGGALGFNSTTTSGGEWSRQVSAMGTLLGAAAAVWMLVVG